MRRQAKSIIRRFGYDVRRIEPMSSPAARRALLLENRDVDLVLDVGAFDGSWAGELRRDGYGGRIVSVEPNPHAFRVLAERAALDRGWDVVQLAVDSEPGSAQLHLGALPVTSSLLETRTNIASFHSWAFEVVGSEDVAVDTLDGLAARLGLEPRRGYLKLDVQGLELRALRGAATVLQRLAAVEIEVNLMPLYRGQPRFDELLTLLAAASFRLGAVTPGSVEPSTGLMGHVDAVFVRDA